VFLRRSHCESGQFDGAQKHRLKKRFGLAFSTVKATKLLKGLLGGSNLGPDD
jgi:hypothetical protein